ncbi:MAG: hypothetical protein E4H18_01355 [Hyphomicrobiales bacterium]|nr:MAG: hypothetical protein E4H18_01355 [Hyphomicrobiales bacterium]
MKNLSFVIAMLFAAFGVPAFAADDAPQPLTRAACDQAGMKWSDRANVCGVKKAHDKKKKAKKKKKHGKKKHGDGAKHDGQGAKDKDKDKGGFKWPWEKKTKDGS